MNAAAKVLVNSGAIEGQWITFDSLIENWKLIALIAVVIFSAFSVVYVKDLNRRLFVQSQGLQQERNHMLTQWNKLLLEESTWGTQARIENLATNRLNMQLPKQSNIVLLQE